MQGSDYNSDVELSSPTQVSNEQAGMTAALVCPVWRRPPQADWPVNTNSEGHIHFLPPLPNGLEPFNSPLGAVPAAVMLDYPPALEETHEGREGNSELVSCTSVRWSLGNTRHHGNSSEGAPDAIQGESRSVSSLEQSPGLGGELVTSAPPPHPRPVGQVTKTNGAFLWMIPDISQHRRESSLCLSSPPMTFAKGCSMCLWLYLNGDGIGKNTHLSLFFDIKGTQTDPLLHRPFKLRVSLVDQRSKERDITRTLTTPPLHSADMNIASGFPKFASKDVLDSYTVKDTLRFVISLD